jgi:hypothetical protein
VLAQRKDVDPAPYARHRPETTILYRVFQENYLTFLETARQNQDSPLPLHVHREIEAYLDCGILANGFIRIRCESCRYEKLVAFSCKKRGFCPSCGGRRMNEVALHLTENVFPKAPVRQWVISFPFSVRYVLAYKPALITKVLGVYNRIISNWYIKAARREGVLSPETGCITFVQRFGSALNLNVHFHTLFLDGVYTHVDGKYQFHRIFTLQDKDIAVLVRRISERVTRFLKRNGFDIDEISDDPNGEEPLLAQIAGASIQNRSITGERAGKRVRQLGGSGERVFRLGKLCAVTEGFSLHARVRIGARARRKLEKLCRYTARPPIALERLSKTPDGKLLYELKTKYHDGTSHVLFDPLELIEKIVAIIPPARANLLRYHGVLAPNSKIRDQIVPKVEKEKGPKAAYPGQQRWAELLKKSFIHPINYSFHSGFDCSSDHPPVPSAIQ